VSLPLRLCLGQGGCPSGGASGPSLPCPVPLCPPPPWPPLSALLVLPHAPFSLRCRCACAWVGAGTSMASRRPSFSERTSRTLSGDQHRETQDGTSASMAAGRCSSSHPGTDQGTSAQSTRSREPCSQSASSALPPSPSRSTKAFHQQGHLVQCNPPARTTPPPAVLKPDGSSAAARANERECLNRALGTKA